MAREFKGSINNSNNEGKGQDWIDESIRDMEKQYGDEMRDFLDSMSEEPADAFSEYSDEEFEEALGNAIANGDEYLKQLKVQHEMDVLNKVADEIGGSEYQKGILRGVGKKIIEEQASFVGEKCNEEKRQKFVRMEGAIKLLAGASGLPDDSVYISRPSRNQRYGMVQIEVPDCFSVTSKNRYYLSELIRLADESTFAVEKNLDGSHIESPTIGMAFTINDVWS